MLEGLLDKLIGVMFFENKLPCIICSKMWYKSEIGRPSDMKGAHWTVEGVECMIHYYKKEYPKMAERME